VQILRAQEREAVARAIAQHEGRGRRLRGAHRARIQEVTYPKPLEELLRQAFAEYCEKVPWASDYELCAQERPARHGRDGQRLQAPTWAATASPARRARCCATSRDAYRVLDRTVPADKQDERLA
jgi:hypothetical protein